MFTRIISALKKAGAETYIIRKNRVESCEIFMIRRRRDMTRAKDATNYSVTVYRDFESGGEKMRGSSQAGIYQDMSDSEIEKAMADAYYAAQFVNNKWFELPDPAKGEDNGADYDLSAEASRLTDAVFTADTAADAFINSAEIFAERHSARIVSSRGADVRYTRCVFKGEMVAQCAYPQDVELYKNFEYDFPNAEALSDLAKKLVATARDRACAADAPKAGEYTLVITGNELATILSAYVEKSEAAMVYAKYSGYAIGQTVQGEDVKGEKLNITLRARTPYSPEGVPMKDRVLTKDSILKTLFGATRHCRYMGIEPTGDYDSITLEGGTMSVEDMKKQGCIYPVAFSDFQMDSFSGYFGGEIRLAYVYDENGVHLVTGGSISGSLFEAQKDMIFSTEKYDSAEYSGPLAARIKGVSVAGQQE